MRPSCRTASSGSRAADPVLRAVGSGEPPVTVDIEGEALTPGGVPVLGRIRFTLGDGDTLAVAGPSGVGKTTLLRVLAGLERRYRGDLAVPESRAIVFQEPTLLPWRTALQNLTIVAGIDAGAARRALDEVGLGGLDGRFPGQLSLGQQRRLALARAVATRPRLLLMDEPFVSLDPALSAEMVALVGALRQRARGPAVLVTHAVAEAEALATRIVRLEGRPARIVEDQANVPARRAQRLRVIIPRAGS